MNLREGISLIEDQQKINIYSSFARMTYDYGSELLISIDSRQDGVILPEHLMNKEIITLSIGRNLPQPVYHFETVLTVIGGIFTTLIFNDQKFHCSFPWHSIVAMAMVDNDYEIYEIKDNMEITFPNAIKLRINKWGDNSKVPDTNVKKAEGEN